jgi:hypothetical protein
LGTHHFFALDYTRARPVIGLEICIGAIRFSDSPARKPARKLDFPAKLGQTRPQSAWALL